MIPCPELAAPDADPASLDCGLGPQRQSSVQRRDGDFVGIALEQLDLPFFFQLLDGHTERGLRHMAGIGPLPKCFSRATATMYLSSVSVMGVIVCFLQRAPFQARMDSRPFLSMS